MSRTTATLVATTLGTGRDYDGTTDLQQFIDAANLIVTRVATCATAKGKTLSSDELEMIERWLAAHFYQMQDPVKTSKSTADASASYGGQLAAGFDLTRYGQMAMRIDYSGCLENIDKRQTAGAVWLGKRPSQQTDYVDRS